MRRRVNHGVDAGNSGHDALARCEIARTQSTLVSVPGRRATTQRDDRPASVVRRLRGRDVQMPPRDENPHGCLSRRSDLARCDNPKT